MNIVCNGCSYTAGEGFEVSDRPKYCYPWLVAKFFDIEMQNIAVSGSSNFEMFKRTVNHMFCNTNSLYIIQWSQPARLFLYPTYDTEISTNYSIDFVKELGAYIGLPHNMICKTMDNIKLLNGDYARYSDLVMYCNIIDIVAKHTGNSIAFVNGLMPIHKDMIFKVKDLSQLSTYTKQLVDFDNNDDEKIWLYYNKLVNAFAQLDLSQWIGKIYQPLNSIEIDTSPVGHHPGKQTHKIYADLVTKHIEKIFK